MKTASTQPPFWLIFLPFACGYFLSLSYRNINAVATPQLVGEFGLTAGDLGLLTSAYFLTFSLAQPVLGVLLDRYGPRRVNACMMLVAAVGGVAFSIANSVATLTAARALIGLGCAVALMSSFKQMADWLPREKLPAANGLALAVGGLGALFASRPAELLLGITTWRILFVGLAAVTVGVAAFLWFGAPDKSRGGEADQSAPRTPLNWWHEFSTMGQVLATARFWVAAFVCAVYVAVFYSLQGVWISGWLRDHLGYSNAQSANVLIWIALALIAGPLAAGWLAGRVRARGGDEWWLVAWYCGVALAVTAVIALLPRHIPAWVWVVFTVTSVAPNVLFAVLAGTFPLAITGRVNTLLNCVMFSFAFAAQWGVGIVIGAWPRTATGYAQEGYRAAMVTLLVLQALALLLLVVWRVRASAPIPDARGD